MDLDQTLGLLASNPHAEVDVAEVALYLARDEYPFLDVEAYLSELDGQAHEARHFVRGTFSARVEGLCRYLFHEAGFHGNRQNYYDPRNSYLNEVLDRMTGIPITLSIVTMAIGRRLGLEIVGLGLPGHFVVQCREENKSILIDPFHGGRRLSWNDCEILVRQATGADFQVSPLNLPPIPPGLLLQRMLNNLRGIYLKQEDWGRASKILGRLQQLGPENVVLRRDMGMCYLRLGQPGKALGYFEEYLDRAPEAEDFATIQQLHQEAERQLSEWN